MMYTLAKTRQIQSKYGIVKWLQTKSPVDQMISHSARNFPAVGTTMERKFIYICPLLSDLVSDGLSIETILFVVLLSYCCYSVKIEMFVVI